MTTKSITQNGKITKRRAIISTNNYKIRNQRKDEQENRKLDWDFSVTIIMRDFKRELEQRGIIWEWNMKTYIHSMVGRPIR